MKPYRYCVVCLLAVSGVFAYTENSLPDLSVPTQLEPGSLELNIAHRFSRTITAEFPDNFIQAANVKIGLRYVLFSKFEVGAAYLTFTREYDLDVGYSYFIPDLFLRTKAAVRFYGAQPDRTQNWNTNFLYRIDLQSEPIVDHFLPVVNLAYDGATKKFGLGTGIDIVLTEYLDVVGEYYPIIGEKEIQNGMTPVNAYLAGLKITTPGHQFMFTVTNNYNQGIRRHMAGALSNAPYYGFNIHRLFSW